MAKQSINVGATANDKKGDSLRAAFQKVNANFTELYTALGLNDTTLNLGNFVFEGNTIRLTNVNNDDSTLTQIEIAQPIRLESDLTVGGDIVPNVANGGNLGSLARPFRSLYVSNNTVFLGGVPLSLEPGTNELRVNNVPISQNISYTDIPNAPTDISDLTDDDGLLSSGTGDITFAATTMSAPDDDAIRIEAKDDNGDVRAYFKVDPADGQVEMRALGSYSRASFSLNDGDWESAQWIADGGTGYLEFTNAPNIIAYFENENTPSDLYIRINGGAPVSRSSDSSEGNNVSVGTGYDFPPSTTVVTTVEFYYMDESRIEIDNDSGIDIYGDQLDISIESTESVYVQGRDVEISASGTLKLQNYADDENIEIVTDGDNEQQTWVFGADGSLTLPGDHKVFTGGDSELILLSLSGMTLGKGDPVELTYDSSVAIGDDVVINTNISGDDIRPWTFGADGNLTLPEGGDILDSTGASVLGGAANEITNTDGEAQPSTYSVSVGTDGVVTMTTSRGVLEFGALPEPGAQSHFHIMRAAGENADLYFGDDFNYVLQRGPAYQGSPAYGVEIGANDNSGGDQQVWRFDTDGSLASNEFKIKTPNGIPTSIGTTSNDNQFWDYNYGSNLATTGGTGTGLTVNVGDGGNGYASISINVAGTGYSPGDVITVTNGPFNGAPYASTVTFTIGISGTRSWTFDRYGALTLPSGTSNIQSVQQNGYQSKVTLDPLRVLSQARRSQSLSFEAAEGDFTSASSDGNGMITFVGLQGGVAEFLIDTMENGGVYERTVRINGAGPEYQYNSFNDTDDELFLVTAAPVGAVTEIRFSYTRISKIDIAPDAEQPVFRIESEPGLDIDIQSGNELRLTATDRVDIDTGSNMRLRAGNGSVQITTNYLVPGATTHQWEFTNGGRLLLPNNTTLKDTVGNAIAFGYEAGLNSQGAAAIAIGTEAGYTSQGANAVAVGAYAGGGEQGANAVAIGYSAGYNGQAANSIVINATGSVLNQMTPNTFTVKPVRQGETANAMYYNSSTGEITYAGAFSFSVAADDSTQRLISNNESIKFIGAGKVNTASDAEGNITITGADTEGSWTVTAGTNTYSFTVPMDGTYVMWVKGNIPNGIITWNATLSISNSNVPAIGTQYAWNYTGGGTPISLTSIPDQVKGVAGTISTDATYAGTTSNRFDFGISNTSGASQIVYYGYTRI